MFNVTSELNQGKLRERLVLCSSVICYPLVLLVDMDKVVIVYYMLNLLINCFANFGFQDNDYDNDNFILNKKHSENADTSTSVFKH